MNYKNLKYHNEIIKYWLDQDLTQKVKIYVDWCKKEKKITISINYFCNVENKKICDEYIEYFNNKSEAANLLRLNNKVVNLKWWIINIANLES